MFRVPRQTFFTTTPAETLAGRADIHDDDPPSYLARAH
jgi:hypothetical protein